jgi:hypothetical protein
MRINRMGFVAFVPKCLVILLLAGCIAASEESSGFAGEQSAADSKDRNPQQGGWDDFPNK